MSKKVQPIRYCSPTYLFRFPTFCRTICRPPTAALFVVRWHVFYPNGVIAARFRLELFLDSPRCCDYRLRFFGIPPRSIPSGTNSLGGQEKSGPVYFSSRRKRRKRHRATTRRIDYYSLRATCRRVVFNRSIARLCHTGAGRILVQADAFPNRNVASSSTNDKL